MMGNSVATGLTHSQLIIWPGQLLTRRAAFRDIKTYPSCVFYMSWFEASDQFKQLSLLWRRHKFKAKLRHADEALTRPKHVSMSALSHAKTRSSKGLKMTHQACFNFFANVKLSLFIMDQVTSKPPSRQICSVLAWGDPRMSCIPTPKSACC